MNPAALRLAGIDATTKAPEGGRIELDAKGNPNGLLRESAMGLLGNLLPDYPDSQIDTGLAEALQEAYGYGITAIIDPSAKEWMLRGYQRADAAGKLALRVKAAVEIEPKEGAAGVAHVLDLRLELAALAVEQCHRLPGLHAQHLHVARRARRQQQGLSAGQRRWTVKAWIRRGQRRSRWQPACLPPRPPRAAAAPARCSGWPSRGCKR